jgi:NADH-quinone oxidoreductase subunit N
VIIRGNRLLAFQGIFVVDAFSDYVKIAILLASMFSIWISLGYLKLEDMAHFEYPILIALATVGMMMMVSANDLIALYVGLELQSLSLYVLAAFNRDNARSTEAGLKYFVLGALSSGLLLYGCSLVYGFSGTTHFEGIVTALSGQAPAIGLIIGIVFIASGLAFKVSAVPFHMWTPDVYEGAPTPVTALFAAAPKFAAIALFVRVLMGPFGAITSEWRQVIVFISAASMIWGAFAAIGQHNIKRLMAYSSIGSVGYALIGLAAGTPAGVRSVLIYMTIYIISTLGAFVIILAMRRSSGYVEEISDVAGLSRTRPVMAFALAAMMLSLAGLPPLAGIFAKFYVFVAAVDAHLVPLAVLGVVTSVVAAFYYLRIVKVIYFDEPAEPFVEPMDFELKLVMGVAMVFVVLLFVYPGPLVKASDFAASAFCTQASKDALCPPEADRAALVPVVKSAAATALASTVVH